MLKRFALVALLSFWATQTFAQLGTLPFSGASVLSTGWHTLNIGGGGFATGVDMQSDGTKLSRTNTGGAYKWNGSQWVQLVDDTLPAAVWSNNQTMGVMEIVAAPSATSTCYMHYFGYMLKSTTGCGAGTWSNLTGWTKDSDLSNAGSAQFGAVGPLIAVDPINASVVLAGSNNTGASGGLYLSSDGGTTFGAVATVAQSSSYIVVAFDPSSAQVGGKTQGVYACSNGTGCYHSINGGGAWTSIVAGGPTACISITVDVNGNLWCADLTVWKYNGTTWSHTYATNEQSGYFYVAIDPNNSTHIFAVTLTGNLNVSLNTGTSWSGPAGTGLPSPTVSSSDVPWLGSTAQSFMTVGKIMFDPAAPTKLYAAAGTGVFFITNPPTTSVTTTALNWTDQTAGQETLVVNQVLASTSAIDAFVWDRSCFKITNTGVGYSNSQTCYPAVSPIGVWAADWCTGSPSTFVTLSSTSFSVDSNDHSSVSTDGGSTWTQWASKPTLIGDGAWTGGIACGGSSSWMYIQGATSGLPSFWNGSGWASITGTSLPTDGWTTNGVSNRRLAADRVTGNTFYIANNGATPGIYTCTGGSCTRTTTSLPDSGEPILVSVPGQSANIFGDFVAHSLQFSTNGGATWTAISTFTGGVVTAVGFGATFNGSSYPSIYVVGTNSGGAYGVWQCKNFNSGTGACTSTWTNLGYPLNTFNEMQWIDGDKNTPGLIYLATNGNGAISGYFP